MDFAKFETLKADGDASSCCTVLYAVALTAFSRMAAVMEIYWWLRVESVISVAPPFITFLLYAFSIYVL